MIQKEIFEGNKTIAVFMGWSIGEFTGFWYQPNGTGISCQPDYTFYHSKWQPLMSVIEKIESLSTPLIEKVWVSISGTECGIWTYFDSSESLRQNKTSTFKTKHASDSKIESVWMAIIEFIKWYNEQKQ